MLCGHVLRELVSPYLERAGYLVGLVITHKSHGCKSPSRLAMVISLRSVGYHQAYQWRCRTRFEGIKFLHLMGRPGTLRAWNLRFRREVGTNFLLKEASVGFHLEGIMSVSLRFAWESSCRFFQVNVVGSPACLAGWRVQPAVGFFLVMENHHPKHQSE